MRPNALMRRFVSAAVFTIAFVCPAVSEDIPANERGFTEYVADRIRTEIPEVPVVVQGPLTVKLGDLQGNLDRLFSFCQRNAGYCSTEVSAYVTAMAESYKAQNAPISRDNIRLVVRSTLYVQQAQSSLGPEAPRLLTAPFVEGLVLVPVLDSPTTFRLINTADLKGLRLSEPQVQDLALANLRAELARRPLMDVAQVVHSGQIGQLVGDSFNPSRLALHDTWAPLAQAQGWKLIVTAPASDAVFYVGDDSPKAIDALRTFARKVMDQAPHSLSDIVLRWTPAGWEVIH